MKIICTENNINKLPEDKYRRIKKDIHRSDGIIHSLIVGREYVVYGLVFRDNCLWYQICHDENDTYPYPYPAELFDLTDSSFSRHWAINGTNNDRIEFFVSSDRIVNEVGYLERLIDGDQDAEEAFFVYRSKIEEEADKGSESA